MWNNVAVKPKLLFVSTEEEEFLYYLCYFIFLVPSKLITRLILRKTRKTLYRTKAISVPKWKSNLFRMFVLGTYLLYFYTGLFKQ